jgi:hypothetical protein
VREARDTGGGGNKNKCKALQQAPTAAPHIPSSSTPFPCSPPAHTEKLLIYIPFALAVLRVFLKVKRRGGADRRADATLSLEKLMVALQHLTGRQAGRHAGSAMQADPPGQACLHERKPVTPQVSAE